MIELTGAETMAVLDMGGAEVTARMGAAERPVPGTTMPFRIDMHKACLFDPASERRII